MDTREIVKVHAKVAAQKGQGCKEDGYEGDDGHGCIGAGTCEKSVRFAVEGGNGSLPMVLNIRDDRLLADASICSRD